MITLAFWFLIFSAGFIAGYCCEKLEASIRRWCDRWFRVHDELKRQDAIEAMKQADREVILYYRL